MMPGRVPGSKKCSSCGWIHLPGARCKARKPGLLALVKTPENPAGFASNQMMPRAAGDFRSLTERLAAVEGRLALVERQIDAILAAYPLAGKVQR